MNMTMQAFSHKLTGREYQKFEAAMQNEAVSAHVHRKQTSR